MRQYQIGDRVKDFINMEEAIAWQQAIMPESQAPVEIIPTYKNLRLEAYNAEGCSPTDILSAFIQKMFDNDNTEFDKIQSKRLEIKSRFPKK